MFSFSAFSLLAVAVGHVHAHSSLFHPSMYGFNVTGSTFPYDNRPVAPLAGLTFDKWWFHGHLDYPPNSGDFFQLPAGKPATTEIACDKGATSFFASSPGGDIRDGNKPCPGSGLEVLHTTGLDDVTGCALAIAYKSDVKTIQPEDFTVFSVNHTCVWTRFTDFQVPARMPPCPPGGCHCAWFWIHSPDSGSEQNYMTGFKCNITGSTSNVALAKPQLPRRCGADPANGVKNPTPGNCTYGAKYPFYWDQLERNNMNEGVYSPPFYNDLYNFRDGAQDDIFQDSYDSIPVPSPDQTAIPHLNTPSSSTGVPALPSSSTLTSSSTIHPSSTGMPALPSSSTSPHPSSTNLPALPSSSTPVSSSLVSPPTRPPSSSTPVFSLPTSSPTRPPSSSTPVLSSPVSSSTRPCHPRPTNSYPSSMDPSPVTVTTTVYVTVPNLPSTSTPSSSTGTPIPSPSRRSDDPNAVVLSKRKPMPMKRMISTGRRHWTSRRLTSNSNMRT